MKKPNASKDKNNDVSYQKEVVNEYELHNLYKENKIIRERVDLYRDFIITLCIKIEDTYLGKAYLKKEVDFVNHFNWAYFKVLQEFDEDGISFYHNDEVYSYFKNEVFEQFYAKDGKLGEGDYKKFWLSLMRFEGRKIRINLNVMIEIYKMFDKSLDFSINKYNKK